MCERLLHPLYTRYGVNEVSLDLGKAYAENVVLDVLRGRYFNTGEPEVIRLRNVTGMGHRMLEPKLKQYCHSLRVLTMENIIFRYNYWLRFLHSLKREFRRLQEVNLFWEVNTSSEVSLPLQFFGTLAK